MLNRNLKQSFRWEFVKPEFGENLAKPIEKSPQILKNSAKNRSLVTPLISKIAASSPAARHKNSQAALGPAADLTLEQIGLNLSQTAKIS